MGEDLTTGFDFPDDPARLVLHTLNLTQSAIIDVLSFMVADWGKSDEVTKQTAIDDLLEKSRLFTEAQRRLLTALEARNGGSDVR